MLGDGCAVDQCAVAALQVLDPEAAIVLGDEAVPAGEGGVANGHLGRAYPANGNFSGGKVDDFVLERAGDYAGSWGYDSGGASCFTHGPGLGAGGCQAPAARTIRTDR